MNRDAVATIIRTHFDVDDETEGLLVAWVLDQSADELVRAAVLHAVADPSVEVEAVGMKLATGTYREDHRTQITVLRLVTRIQIAYPPLHVGKTGGRHESRNGPDIHADVGGNAALPG